MTDISAEFSLEPEVNLTADFELNPDPSMEVSYRLNTFENDHTQLINRDVSDQHPISAITGLRDELDSISEDITLVEGNLTQAIENEQERAELAERDLADDISDEATTRQTADNTLTINLSNEVNARISADTSLTTLLGATNQTLNAHIADVNNPHQVTKSQVGLGNVSNLAPADLPISTATHAALGNKVSKSPLPDKVYGTDSDGEQTIYDVDSFGKVDDVKVGGTSVVTDKIANLGTMANENVTGYLKNKGTGTKALAVGDTSQSTAEGGVAIGYGARANSTYSTAVGYDTRATNTNTTVIGKGAKATQARAIAIGSGAEANAQDAIAIKGINSTANTMQVYSYTLLNMADGLIPDERISTNIARTSALSSYVTLGTGQTISGAKTFSNTVTLQGQTPVTASAGYNSYAVFQRLPDTREQIFSNGGDKVRFRGSETRPKYNSNDLALYSDVTTGDSNLQNQINDLKSRGHFLALWNCSTGLAESNPPTSPYVYQAGDYFIVGTVGSTNYAPSGSQYETGVASTTIETGTVEVDDTYYYDGTVWKLQINTEKTTAFVNIAGSPYDNTNLASALNAKVDSSSLATVATTGDYDDLIDKPTIPTDTSDLTNSAGFITSSALSGYATQTWVGSQGYITGITSSDVTTALGYTPYNSTNPNGYITGISSSDVTTALGYTPYDASNPSGYTSNVGTVTSVNNTSPDGSGNVTITIPDALPSQTGHSGEFLTTDGTDASWGSPDLSGKADVDMSNVNVSGKSLISGLPMPSNRYTDLTLGASGSTYTAPANGYFYLEKIAGATGKYLALYNNTTGLSFEAYPNATSNYARTWIIAKKGDSVTAGYNVTGATQNFRFIYAEGEPNV